VACPPGPYGRAMPRIAAAALAALAVAAASPAHAAATRGCGLTPRVDGVRYQVKVEEGRVTCKTAKRVATKFARTDRMRPARGWVCFRGHGSQPAASCSGPHGAVVRVYAPG
jgi:hypothetical protein